jgi:hypothetical protein
MGTILVVPKIIIFVVMLTIVSEHIQVYFHPEERENGVAATKSVKKLLTATSFMQEKCLGHHASLFIKPAPVAVFNIS